MKTEQAKEHNVVVRKRLPKLKLLGFLMLVGAILYGSSVGYLADGRDEISQADKAIKIAFSAIVGIVGFFVFVIGRLISD